MAEIDLSRAGIVTPHVRQNFVKVAPDPFEVSPLFRKPKFSLGGPVISAPGGGGGGGPSLDELGCFGFGGAHVQVATGVAGSTTRVFVSKSISRPFVLRHIETFSSVVDPDSIGFIFKIASDNDTNGGEDTTGVRLDTIGPGTADMAGVGVATSAYPSSRWDSVPAYIKFIIKNGNVGPIFIHMVASFEYLQ